MTTTTIKPVVCAHFSGGVCEDPYCVQSGFAGYDGHTCWPTQADYDADHHPDGTYCYRYRPCGQPDCPKTTALDPAPIRPGAPLDLAEARRRSAVVVDAWMANL
jgi:hypothetical protein